MLVADVVAQVELAQVRHRALAAHHPAVLRRQVLARRLQHDRTRGGHLELWRCRAVPEERAWRCQRDDASAQRVIAQQASELPRTGAHEAKVVRAEYAGKAGVPQPYAPPQPSADEVSGCIAADSSKPGGCAEASAADAQQGPGSVAASASTSARAVA